MSNAIMTWIATDWWTVLIFLVGWIAVGFVAGRQLSKGTSIFAAFLLALFGVGGHLLVILQIPEDVTSPFITQVLPVLSGVFCILVLFLAYSKKPSEEEGREGGRR